MSETMRPSWDGQFRETDYERAARFAYRRGKNANLAGRPRNPDADIDWLRGWDDAEDDRRLGEDQW